MIFLQPLVMWARNRTGNDSELQEMMLDELHVTCTSTVARMSEPLGHSSYFGQSDTQYIFPGVPMVSTSLERGREG